MTLPIHGRSSPKKFTGRASFCLVLLFAAACQRDKPSPLPQGNAAVSATLPPPAIKPESSPKPASGCAGKYQGKYIVSVTKPGIGRKEGAPAEWESDDGHALAGEGEVTLAVDGQNEVTGAAKGALGQQTLRGRCDENTLRVSLDAVSTDPQLIQNAFLVADMSGAQATGTITAASGNALIRRRGTVNLQKTQ